jgi:hypothetical protein
VIDDSGDPFRLRASHFAVTSRLRLPASPLASGSASGYAVTSRRDESGLARDDAHDPVIPSEEHRIVSLIGDGRVDFLQARYHY